MESLAKRCPNLLGMPLDYMESCGVFKSLKTSKYSLCCFYKVGLSGDFPMTTCTTFWRKPVSVQGQTCWWCTHRMQSQQFACFENSTPMPTFNTLRWRLMLMLVTNPRGSCHSAHSVNTQVVMTSHTSITSSAHITM